MMADHHKGYGVPIGGVIAHETLVSPSGVGYDIGCGNKAVLTDADAADVRANISRMMDDVWSNISFGLARTNKEPVDHELFGDNNDDAWQITQGARFLNRAGAKDDMDSAPVALDPGTQEGQDYIAAMKLAGRYAYG
jgi:tRNA-splicing ligase RtcB